MPLSRLDALKTKAKLLQKAKKRSGKPIALKEAFALIATSAGFASWREMKAALDIHELLRPPHSSALWSVWYGKYDDAAGHLQEQGGYLLPYQKQYFICDEHYIVSLGIQLGDPDLEKIGPDWARPKDVEAWNRILKKIVRKKGDV